MEYTKKDYKFSNGLEASQEELTLLQDYELMDLISGVDAGSVSLTSMTIIDAIKRLREHKLIEKALAIILSIEENSDNFKKLSGLKNSELQEVFTDFFTLNPIVPTVLQNFAAAADLTNGNLKSQNTEHTLSSDAEQTS